jgi:hypothetical protein
MVTKRVSFRQRAIWQAMRGHVAFDFVVRLLNESI